MYNFNYNQNNGMIYTCLKYKKGNQSSQFQKIIQLARMEPQITGRWITYSSLTHHIIYHFIIFFMNNLLVFLYLYSLNAHCISLSIITIAIHLRQINFMKERSYRGCHHKREYVGERDHIKTGNQTKLQESSLLL